MGWVDVVNAVGVVGALGVGAYQLRTFAVEGRQRDADRRIERSLELYEDVVVGGDTAEAFHRLSVLLRHRGTEQFGRTTWLILTDDDFDPGGVLDPSATGVGTPFADFYRIIWFFERAENALDFGLLNEDVFFRTTGFHCWWWGQLLGQVSAAKAMKSLRGLAPRAEQWARTEGLLESWMSHCLTDFNGGPAAVAGAGPKQTPGPV